LRLGVQQFLKRRYRILSLLGEGGTSEVYLAWDEKRSVKVALKLLLEKNSAASLAAFQNEAQALTLLQHPNIVTFYGMEQDGDNLFIVMDYIEGISLSHEIRAARPDGLPLRHMLEIIQPICSALNYAHQKGIVHCDIKPGNIMIRSQGDVLLTDFGIARVKGENSAMMQGAGTLAYMSPEQVQGLPLTPQMDIYALGVVLYEMATGRKPFIGRQSPEGGDDRERLRWEQVNLAPPSPRVFRPDLPLEVEMVILKCLSKEPGRRYANTLQLRQAFEQALNAQPLPPVHPVNRSETAAQPTPPPVSQAPQPAPLPARRRNTGALTILAGIAVTALVVLGGFTLFRPMSVAPTYSPGLTASPANSTSRTYPAAFDYSGKCATFILPQKSDAQVEECVTRIEVQPDQTLKIYFRWALRSVTLEGVTIGSDEGNPNMYLLDNLNRRLDQVKAGGQAIEKITLINGQAKNGWFMFPAPPADARSFAFHDDDNQNIIQSIERRW
jgi:eukaryotic-like serine/threonine-protein kinase